MNKNRYAVILCGGSGSRLWPLSRKKNPKQFLKFDNDYSLFQKTLLRSSNFIDPNNIYVVTNEEQKFLAIEQASELNLDQSINYVFEPELKNTLPAISLSVKHIHEKNPNAIITVLPSDHLIAEDYGFKATIQDAFNAAESNHFILIGIIPDHASTSYGYIKPDQNFSSEVKSVKSFEEKPNTTRAKKYFMNGYYWNAGMFIFKSCLFLNELSKYQKKLYKMLIDKKFNLNDFYKNCDSTSIDYGLIEKISNLKVIAAKFSWTDLGSWDSVFKSSDSDEFGNSFSKNVIHQSTKNTYAYSDNKLIALSDVTNLIIVDTKDTLLILKKSKSEKVKELVNLVAESNSELVLHHNTVYRPWGYYKVLLSRSNFKIKEIFVKPKSRLSLQSHNYRSEHWIVTSGTASIQKNDDFFDLSINESTFIPVRTKHRLMNKTNEDLRLIEVACGEYISEDDIERFEDDYGR